MKRWLVLCLLPAVALAATPRDDYRQQWPLQLARAGAGAYYVTLTPDVYRTAHDAQALDLQPLNAAGQALPAALAPPEAALEGPSRRQPLPVFALPPSALQDDGVLQVVAERDASGAVRRIETQTGPAVRAGGGWLVDASALSAPMRALLLEWPAQPRVQVEVRLEGSQDLRRWSVIEPRVTLLELANARERLQQRRLPLGAGARYLRVVPLAGELPALTAAYAELASAPPPAAWQWLTLAGRARGPGFEFTLDGRFPVAQVDVTGGDADAVEWTLQSRDAEDAPWLPRAGPWLAYRLGEADRGDRSRPQPLAQPTRDRYWRLLPRAGSTPAVPRLRLGYRPERMLFLAQGAGPYALAAGSARARRSDAPLPQMIDALRHTQGAAWQPAQATLAPAPQVLAGTAALQPAAPPRDWKAWLLWALLVAGAAVVAGLAISLLRGGGTPDDRR